MVCPMIDGIENFHLVLNCISTCRYSFNIGHGLCCLEYERQLSRYMLCMLGNYSVVETPCSVGSNTVGIFISFLFHKSFAHKSVNEV